LRRLGIQETPRRHPGDTQEAPRKHPGDTQEALRKPLGSHAETTGKPFRRPLEPSRRPLEASGGTDLSRKANVQAFRSLRTKVDREHLPAAGHGSPRQLPRD